MSSKYLENSTLLGPSITQHCEVLFQPSCTRQSHAPVFVCTYVRVINACAFCVCLQGCDPSSSHPAAGAGSDLAMRSVGPSVCSSRLCLYCSQCFPGKQRYLLNFVSFLYSNLTLYLDKDLEVSWNSPKHQRYVKIPARSWITLDHSKMHVKVTSWLLTCSC